MENRFTVLFDYDSLIYKATWRVCSISDIRGWIREGRSRSWMEKEIVNLTINRLSNMGDGILQDIEDTGVNAPFVEYFLTACRRSVRKRKVKRYKKTRRPNKWVNLVRKELLRMGFAQIDDEWEADDLIKDRAMELGEDQVVICTMDKDLKQIPGIHFDYYRPRAKETKYNEFGHKIPEPCRGLNFYTREEARVFFWTQMLTGDSTDDIKGVPGIGPKRAEKALRGLQTAEELRRKVHQIYCDKFGEDEGQRQFHENVLLIGLGINYRDF